MSRRIPSRLLTGVLVVGALVAVGWVVLWAVGPGASPFAFALLALTPVAVLGALLVAVVALGTRRWVIGGVALVAALALAAVVLPRALADEDPPTAGVPTLAVATANLEFGEADAGALVALVRAERIDVLGLEELTPDAETRLADAGLFAELPFRALEARPGPGGTGLASRYPLTSSGLPLAPGMFTQVTARVLGPVGPVDVVVAHPAAPVFRADSASWAREIVGLPAPAGPGGPARLLIGDFNATLDHRPLRELVGRGHRDAAAALGDGLLPTWPTDQPFPPFAAIDHVLVSGPLRPAALSTHRVAGTDHATLVVRVAAP
jgi:endonuclease/exonuclease/phosphatase (EEP) superfamily protein YafD